jgi:probable HAF family extracellular repeat protein
MEMRYFVATALCPLCLMFAVAPPAMAYLPIADVGSLYGVDPGNTYDDGQGYSISPNGRVAGTAWVGAGGITAQYTSAFLWTPTTPNGTTGATVDLGHLSSQAPVVPTSEVRGTSGINNSGQVVGDSPNSAAATHAFLYSGGSMYDLGCLGDNAAATSRAYGINASGEVCGLSYMNGSGQSGYSQIFLWNPTSPNATTGTMYNLGGLGAGGAVLGNGIPRAINDHGQVAGVALGSASTGTAFLWTPTSPQGTTGSMVDIGSQLTGAGFTNVQAENISSNGMVVGYGTPPGGTDFDVFLWTPTSANGSTGTMLDLTAADPTDFGTESRAFGVNRSGMVVGSSGNGANAFLYDNGVYTNLNNLINPASGWTALSYAMAINDANQITGWGVYNGNNDAFLLTLLPGDANFDGKVDVNDLTIVLANFGKTVGASWTTGDFNGDGRVDVNDLTIVLANFGKTAGASIAVAPVPEPSTVLLAAFGLAGMLACARQKRK